MGLDIIVVGAGIGGLTTAITLHQAGHSVRVFERFECAAEIGAALGLSPNGSQVLAPLGFDFKRARAVPIRAWDIVNALTLDVVNKLDLTMAAAKFGFDTYAVHRVDFHTELLRLAQLPGAGNPNGVELRLASPVVGGNAEEGWIQLEDGSKHSADLIVGADGIRSVIRKLVTDEDLEPISTKLGAFRFLVPTEKLRADPALARILEWKGDASAALLANLADPIGERHMMWYACRDGEVQNFVGVHAARPIPVNEDGTQDFKAAMLEDFEAYDPEIKRLIEQSEHVSCWALNIHAPLKSWVKGKMVLIGDAAHPMLPFGGQGANQALEDAGALGVVLNGVDDAAQIPARLSVYEKVRINRASLIQTLSKVRVGFEKQVEHEITQYVPPGAKVPGSFAERSGHAFSYNVIKATQAALAEAQ